MIARGLRALLLLILSGSAGASLTTPSSRSEATASPRYAQHHADREAPSRRHDAAARPRVRASADAHLGFSRCSDLTTPARADASDWRIGEKPASGVECASAIGVHRYLYAYGNPGLFVDPDGRVAVAAPWIAEGLAWTAGRLIGAQASRSAVRWVIGPTVGAVVLYAGNQLLDARHQAYQAEFAAQSGQVFESGATQSMEAMPNGPTVYTTPAIEPSEPWHTGGPAPALPDISTLPGRSIETQGATVYKTPIPEQRQPELLIFPAQDELLLPVLMNEADDGSVASSSESSGIPDWLRNRFKEGNDFNERQREKYPYNEVYIDPPCQGGACVRLDSYNPVAGGGAGEIVSRKYTQLTQVQTETAINYMREMVRKYSPGKKIADVQSNRATGLAGQPLRGQMILEVPKQNAPVPPQILDEAKARDIRIRDEFGNEH